MSTSRKLKILVVGDLRGKLAQMLAKVRQLSEKAGVFDAFFCIGQFFGDGSELQPYISGKEKVEVPTYFLTRPEEEKYLPSDLAPTGQVVENLTYLGACGMREIAGIQVAFFSGTRDESQRVNFDQKLLGALLSRSRHSSFSGVDLLLTNHWSQGLLSNLKDVTIMGLPTTEQSTFGSETVTSVCEALTPRYHFSASPNHLAFERAPYLSELPHRPVTRFVALAEVFNSRKAKFMYAFSLEPMSALSHDTLLITPEGTTSSPFAFRRAALEAEKQIGNSKKRKFDHLEEADAKSGTQMFFDQRRAQRGMEYHERQERMQASSSQRDPIEQQLHGDRKASHHERMHQQHRQHESQDASNRNRGPPRESTGANRHERQRRFDRNDPAMQKKIHPLMQRTGCWFCLSNPNVEEHLIVSVGDQNYVALAKGGLNPEHSLIIPIEHVSTFDITVNTELQRFKDSLVSFYHSKDMEVIFWDRKLDSAHAGSTVTSDKNHAALQVLPVSKNLLPAIQLGFDTQLEHFGLMFMTLEQNQDPSSIVGTSGFLFLDIPDISSDSQASEEPSKEGDTSSPHNGVQKRKRLLAIIPDKKRVPLQLPRKVIAQAMEQPQREDWKQCVISKEEEDAACAALKSSFVPFDFTLLA